METLPERDACRLTVELLSLAHERNVEAALADVIQGDLDAGTLPDLADMRARFEPNPACVPKVTIQLEQLVDYDSLISTRMEVMAEARRSHRCSASVADADRSSAARHLQGLGQLC